MAITEGIIAGQLVTTLDKQETLKTLRQWRYESDSPEEADLLTDLIHKIEQGELDG